MDESVKEQSSVSGNGGKAKLQKYALRSAAAKLKEEKAETANSPASRRARPPSAVSKSIGVLDLSGKEKPAKPPRRLSVPAKSNASSTSKLVGTITPISEARVWKAASNQAKSQTTPLSDVSRSSIRRKLCVLSSASYWLQQIKLSETAAKHSVSLGFFKLALEAGCELQKMREELKCYALRHNLTELEEPLKELFDIDNVVESVEQLQVSETCSQVPEEGTRSSDDVRSSSSTIEERKIKPRSLNNDVALASHSAAEPAKGTSKKNPATEARKCANKNSARSRSVPDSDAGKMQKKAQKSLKAGSNIEKEKIKRQGDKSAIQEGPDATPPAQDVIENKENLDGLPTAAISAGAM